MIDRYRLEFLGIINYIDQMRDGEQFKSGLARESDGSRS